MRVAIAGGHGKIARRLTRLLRARGDEVTSLIRNPGHAGDVRSDGGGTLHTPSTIGKKFEVVSGDVPIEEAVASI